jgi:hypothetical protein
VAKAKEDATLITRKTFMERFHCSASALSDWCKGPLSPALEGRNINMAHPCVKAFFESRKNDKRTFQVDIESLPDPDYDMFAGGKASKKYAGAPPTGTGPSADFRDFDDIQYMTLGEICERFGGLKQCEEHLKAYKTWQEAKKTEIVNHKAMARLVSRELVQAGVFTHMDQMHRRLLNEFPELITRLVYQRCNAGDPVEVSREVVRQNISKIITHAVDKVKRGMKGLNEDDGESAFDHVHKLEELQAGH